MHGWIDAHLHLQDPRLGNPLPIIAAMRAVGVQSCIVNSTCEADWPAVEKLANDHPGFVFPAFGIHPWHAHSARPGWKDRLTALIKKHPHASIGECGLDQWIAEPNIELQKSVFSDHLRIAQETQRPLSIHALKAWAPLFATLHDTPPTQPFLMHSFGGSIEIARRLLPLGAYFSFSGYFHQTRKSATAQVFCQLPQDRILVESDAPDMLPPPQFISHPLPENHNHPANLPAIATALAHKLGLTPRQLAALTRHNTRQCFHF